MALKNRRLQKQFSLDDDRKIVWRWPSCWLHFRGREWTQFERDKMRGLIDAIQSAFSNPESPSPEIFESTYGRFLRDQAPEISEIDRMQEFVFDIIRGDGSGQELALVCPCLYGDYECGDKSWPKDIRMFDRRAYSEAKLHHLPC